jgi:hypothetical protein
VFAFVGLPQNLKDLKREDDSHPDPSDLKTAIVFGSFLRKGEVLAYVGRIHNLKD